MAESTGFPKLRTDLAYYGTVTRVISATQFVAAGLAGLGDGALAGYAAYVMGKANGTTTPPHGEQPAVSVYVSATGTFTHAPYTAGLAVGDQLLLLHPSIASIGPGGSSQGSVYYGVVTAVPGLNQFSVAGLIGLGDTKFTGWYAYVFRQAGGLGAPPHHERQIITVYTSAGGVFTTNPFTAPVGIGDEILILNPSLVGGQLVVAANAVVANWQAGEQNLVTIGADDVPNKLHSFYVGIQNLAGNISIRLYTQVNGVERRFYPYPAVVTFSVALDAPAIPVVNNPITMHEAIRVTIQSDAVADNGRAVDYDYILEAL
jgi:hypothetical protein